MNGNRGLGQQASEPPLYDADEYFRTGEWVPVEPPTGDIETVPDDDAALADAERRQSRRLAKLGEIDRTRRRALAAADPAWARHAGRRARMASSGLLRRRGRSRFRARREHRRSCLRSSARSSDPPGEPEPPDSVAGHRVSRRPNGGRR
jgi:hypothetical protein